MPSHFGPFIVASLWAPGQLAGRIDGIVFLSPHRRNEATGLAPDSIPTRNLAMPAINLLVLFLTEPAAGAGLGDGHRAGLRQSDEQRLKCRFTDPGPAGEPIPAAV